MTENRADIIGLTADIVAAHVASNTVATTEVATLIQSVYDALSAAGAPPAPEPEAPTPIVSVKASVKPSYIVCLECGAKQKMLKRHLSTAHGLTPADYFAKWNLPKTYPLVSADYAAQRADLAKKIGLGRKPAAVAKAVAPIAKKAKASGETSTPGVHTPGKAGTTVPAKRGRKPAAAANEAAKS